MVDGDVEATRGGDWNRVCFGDVDDCELVAELPLVVFLSLEVSSIGEVGCATGFGGSVALFPGSAALTGVTG